MMKKEIRLEDLVGRRVRDAQGSVIGRIREVEAEWHGPRCVVTSFHLDGGMRVPMTAMDLADPKRPRIV
jgi:sporulation protein YlmC with PRC-barrel domain